MTKSFSIGEAMVTPSRVIRRHPLAVFAWGFVIMAFSLGAVALMFGALADFPLADGAEPPPEMFGQLMAFQGVSMLLNFGQMFLAVVIWAATMRATLRIGQPDRFFFLRVGMDELRLAVVGLALFFGAYVAVIILVMLGFALGFTLWQINEPAAVIAGVVMSLALIVAVAVAMARLSLIAPATMMLKRFAFVEGWTLGKRRTLPLLGLLACTWLVYMALYFVAAFVIIVVLFASGVFAGFGQGAVPETFGDLFPTTGSVWAVVALLLILGSFVYGVVLTLLSAPFVSACRQLMDGAPSDAPQDGLP
ncbi:hypothetical protein GCM10017620_05870 [Brevundimonas intermedia]|uniref:Glycerophosphoryl diester phosphodiesterase membrane domain-containing protein n=1 Tax=Brevundimonas intermedia TaxID=74315 RepID=A0ABQ5T4C6_9CAUL|nr:hypothetical protein [Brevundimonas intermedia]GLK47614.1 hypothetical protein GCM10017620_05870 [Brevundimonas intermedia]